MSISLHIQKQVDKLPESEEADVKGIVAAAHRELDK